MTEQENNETVMAGLVPAMTMKKASGEALAICGPAMTMRRAVRAVRP